MRRLTLILVLAASCGGDASPVANPSSAPPDQVTGVITEVHIEGDEVTAFVVETHDGTHEILIDPEYEYGFDLRHLEVHRDSGDPVQVYLEVQDGKLYAYGILDA